MLWALFLVAKDRRATQGNKMQELSQQSLPVMFNPSWDWEAAWHNRGREVAESTRFE